MSETDYRALCLELFGTINESDLRSISSTLSLRSKNSRNAGRKRKLTNEDLVEAQNLLSQGYTISEVAKKYNTSRQIISKYINKPPEVGYTLRLAFMHQNTPCTIIDVNFRKRKIKIQNRTDNLLRRAFGINENPIWEDFEEFLEDRCVPRNRGDIAEILRALDLTDYDPLQIIEKTQGRLVEDRMWIRCNYYPIGGGKDYECG